MVSVNNSLTMIMIVVLHAPLHGTIINTVSPSNSQWDNTSLAPGSPDIPLPSHEFSLIFAQGEPGARLPMGWRS